MKSEKPSQNLKQNVFTEMSYIINRNSSNIKIFHTNLHKKLGKRLIVGYQFHFCANL